MKKTMYVSPAMECVELVLDDVIRTSGEGYGLSLDYGEGVKVGDLNN